MSAYFTRESDTRFGATANLEGAWSTTEQHIAPSLGLIAHCIERDSVARRGDGALQVLRMSYDILGTVPLEAVDVQVSLLRPGRTIELVEARLTHGERTIVIARAWLSERYDTQEIAGSALEPLPPRDAMQPWESSSTWPGKFISTIEGYRDATEPGRGRFWLRSSLALLAGEPIGAVARALALVDVANGVVPRTSPNDVRFPNLDLTVHLTRAPRGEWLGFDTRVTFGPTGAGLTHSILHDEAGPLGSVAQTLTVRPF
ncbi:thioesterase family protein [Micrococcales bacterium 31B]|nr:thioesterase family protein [Micrococcales bacterium 31B]